MSLSGPPGVPDRPTSTRTREDTPPTRPVPRAGVLTRVLRTPEAYFLAALGAVAVSVLADSLPSTMISGFALSMVLGGLLTWVGNRVPGLRSLGLPTVLCTFLPALLAFAGLLPPVVSEAVAEFTDGVGFLDFVVVALVTGSVLGMPRELLLRAGPRFIVPLFACVVVGMFGTAALGALVGYGFRETLFFVSAPVLAGGIGLGALPMSDMYASEFGGTAGEYLPTLMSAVVIANVLCILIAGVYNGIGRFREPFAGFNGRGRLMRFRGGGDGDGAARAPRKRTGADFSALGRGLLVTCALFLLGSTLEAFVPMVHAYAWTILLAAVLKVFRLLPESLEEASSAWGEMVVSLWLPALLVGVSLSYIDVSQVVDAVSDPLFVVLVATCVLVSAATSGAVGWLVRMYFVESSIVPGLVMTDSGGSGDVAVLSAADRLSLMPFAQLSTRLGGVVVLALTSLLLPLVPSA